MPIRFHRDHIGEMITHAWEVTPAECCGLVGGSGSRATSLYRLRNVAAEPEIRYEAAPEDLFAAQRQMRERGEELLAIYHSHPGSTDPKPSETDIRQAFYPSATYLIIGLAECRPTVNAFSISEREHRWQAVEYEIVDE